MGQATLERIINEMRTLKPEELREIERAARDLLVPKGATDEERFLESLREAGLVNDIKRPARDVEIERPLVPIQGKPLSETIIEERG